MTNKTVNEFREFLGDTAKADLVSAFEILSEDFEKFVSMKKEELRRDIVSITLSVIDDVKHEVTTSQLSRQSKEYYSRFELRGLVERVFSSITHRVWKQVME